jgi:hypothetical protein
LLNSIYLAREANSIFKLRSFIENMVSKDRGLLSCYLSCLDLKAHCSDRGRTRHTNIS